MKFKLSAKAGNLFCKEVGPSLWEVHVRFQGVSLVFFTDERPPGRLNDPIISVEYEAPDAQP